MAGPRSLSIIASAHFYHPNGSFDQNKQPQWFWSQKPFKIIFYWLVFRDYVQASAFDLLFVGFPIPIVFRWVSVNAACNDNFAVPMYFAVGIISA